MKKVELICVGKIKESFFREGIAEYTKRLTRFCNFSIVEAQDFADHDNSRERESALILKRLQGGNATKILLEIKGEMYSSEQIAKKLDDVYSSGQDKVIFVVGGSFGVTDEVKAACDIHLSFGRVTYPHQLMRLLVCEQIYRAFTISEGLPYHK